MSFAIRQPEGMFQALMAPGAAIGVAMAGNAGHWGKREIACGVVSVINDSPATAGALATP